MKYIIHNDSSKPDEVIFQGVAAMLRSPDWTAERVATFQGGYLIASYANKNSIRFMAQDC